MPNKYRKMPVEIEAMRFDSPAAAKAIKEWSAGQVHPHEGDPVQSNPSHLIVVTLEGTMIVSKGDWVIRGVKGEFYPCKPDIFAATYEPVPVFGARND